jgi:hypothetical protein
MWSVGIVLAYMIANELPFNVYHLSDETRIIGILDLIFEVLGNPSP